MLFRSCQKSCFSRYPLHPTPRSPGTPQTAHPSSKYGGMGIPPAPRPRTPQRKHKNKKGHGLKIGNRRNGTFWSKWQNRSKKSPRNLKIPKIAKNPSKSASWCQMDTPAIFGLLSPYFFSILIFWWRKTRFLVYFRAHAAHPETWPKMAKNRPK